LPGGKGYQRDSCDKRPLGGSKPPANSVFPLCGCRPDLNHRRYADLRNDGFGFRSDIFAQIVPTPRLGLQPRCGSPPRIGKKIEKGPSLRLRLLRAKAKGPRPRQTAGPAIQSSTSHAPGPHCFRWIRDGKRYPTPPPPSNRWPWGLVGVVPPWYRRKRTTKLIHLLAARCVGVCPLPGSPGNPRKPMDLERRETGVGLPWLLVRDFQFSPPRQEVGPFFFFHQVRRKKGPASADVVSPRRSKKARFLFRRRVNDEFFFFFFLCLSGLYSGPAVSHWRPGR